jgi:TatD family-associated radical SAM protein
VSGQVLNSKFTVGYTIRGSRYLNVTNRCTLRCTFCPKFNGQWAVRDHDLRLRRDPTAEEIFAAVGNPADYGEIVFCGLGEPTLRLAAVLDVARRLEPSRVPRRLNTDGLGNLVHGRDITMNLMGSLEAISVSLNAQDEDTYNRHCRPKLAGSYAAMLDFVRRVRDVVPEVTLTAIDGLPGVDIGACEAIAASLGVKFRRRVLDAVG